MFAKNNTRYATTGVVSNLPSQVIDSVWFIIDQNLKGVFPLNNLIAFQLENNQGKLTMGFSNDGENIQMRVDLPFPYKEEYPSSVLAYDDGFSQTILLPNEAEALD